MPEPVQDEDKDKNESPENKAFEESKRFAELSNIMSENGLGD
jgi:hypothetical protein